MGRVIDLEAWRRGRFGTGEESDGELAREPGNPALVRLERAVARLDSLVRRGTGRIGPRVETDLLTITGAVVAGRVGDAAMRAERLAVRLEHPSSLAAR